MTYSIDLPISVKFLTLYFGHNRSPWAPGHKHNYNYAYVEAVLCLSFLFVSF